MDFSSRSAIERAGFGGFLSVADLRTTRYEAVPTDPGVYMLLRPDDSPVRFLAKSSGCSSRDDPTLPIADITRFAVPGAPVLYIGKAGGEGKKATLHDRIKAYLRFGDGRNSGHSGGKRLWQIAGSQNLLVCWQVLTEDPRTAEKRLLAAFRQGHGGRLPFANDQA